MKGDSRFERDYEVKRRLGKGGFGVVYRVKNKLDAVEYAIKLIKLPSRLVIIKSKFNTYA